MSNSSICLHVKQARRLNYCVQNSSYIMKGGKIELFWLLFHLEVLVHTQAYLELENILWVVSWV